MLLDGAFCGNDINDVIKVVSLITVVLSHQHTAVQKIRKLKPDDYQIRNYSHEEGFYGYFGESFLFILYPVYRLNLRLSPCWFFFCVSDGEMPNFIINIKR